MNRLKRIGLAMLAASLVASASADDIVAPRSGFSLGGRGEYFKAKDADKGSWSGGAQGRLHFTSVIAVEGSIDYRQTRFEGAIADIYPVQASLLLYLLPNSPVSPYVLGGAGWYYTHVRSPFQNTDHRFGPHAGGGLELFLNRKWSVDADYRYVWVSSINSPTSAHPLGKDFSDRGHMITIGLNYWF